MRLRRFATAALALVVLGAGGCVAQIRTPEDDTILLKVDIFGDQGFGYDELYAKFEQANPGIRVIERGKGRALDDHDIRLNQWLKSGAGAGDVVGLEEGTIVSAKAQADKFLNLLDYGAGEDQAGYLPWKWELGMTADGSRLVGLGTDVGSMAICYRRDLFAEAGLPTDREAVGRLWPDWNGFIAAGRRFRASDVEARFIDSATNVFNTVLMQMAGERSGFTFYDKSNKLVVGTNADVKQAWDLTVDMIDAGLSANLRSWSDAWVNGFREADFATIACPAWMTGVIKGNAGDGAAGKWDVARAPGAGGNWGGSYLAVPAQSKHPREAVALARFLTSAESQLAAFAAVGNLPSKTAALDAPVLQQKQDAYFSNAPTGAIFGGGAKALKPVHLGPKNQAVRNVVEEALRSVELGQATSDAGWRTAVTQAGAADQK